MVVRPRSVHAPAEWKEKGMTYSIVRFHQSGPRKILKEGLTLEEAQAWCGDPETSSRTCTGPEAVAYTGLNGPWFDGYREE
jgi:hypothetical protein